ncbi:hypothetical protein PVAND_010598 [Polypedilum vanderplanki]|uniref:F-box domain-containing protein n=1 Tax=Polypedilum vanderplanki TaxID=319348 RepID=A0A9J6CG38_POLVA|nr:hypothetical protein PVAND_010598 [Polypedilum vanderplanki]
MDYLQDSSSSDHEHIQHQHFGFGSSLSSLDVHQLDFLQKNTHINHPNYFHHQEPVHRNSPSFDQGYQTLLSSPTQSALSNHHLTPQVHVTSKLVSEAMNTVGLAHKVANLSISTNSLCSLTKVGRNTTAYMIAPSNKSHLSFDSLPNDMIIKIFQWLDTCELLTVATVCRRFEKLIWNPILWKIIILKGEEISGDKALSCILRRLQNESDEEKCLNVERVMLSEGCKITDKGLQMIVKACPNLTHLQAQFCTTFSNQSLIEFVSKCTNLQHLDITGCSQISCININPSSSEGSRKLLLQYIDLTDCASLDDNGLRLIVKTCPLLIYFYLRRCMMLTDTSLKYISKFCIALKELSVSDCLNVTDFGLYELAKLGQTLRYLSVAKCKVSDVGLKYLARRCYKLRYLNCRGCEAISDDSIIVLARSCSRLRSLDIGKTDVSDAGLCALSESCPNLKKLSLKNCDMITDEGIKYLSYYCRGLQLLNIQDCNITADGYKSIKKFCRRCVIQHNNLILSFSLEDQS